VCNSTETNASAFKRERDIFLECSNFNGRVVYFSSCAVNYMSTSRSLYIDHKLTMEELCKKCNSFLIIRLPQIVGFSKNPHTLTNYFNARIKNGLNISVFRNTKRVLVDVEDVVHVTNELLARPDIHNKIINISHPFAVSALSLVMFFESVLKLKAIYDIVDDNTEYIHYDYPTLDISKNASLNIDYKYPYNLINKYYGS
jgi:nucleoside-diphosphate-sugar epimerase